LKVIDDYNEHTSAYELYTFFADRIVQDQILTFEEAAKLLDTLPADSRREFVAKRVFLLLKGMHWGFFRNLNKSKFPKLWRELVIEYKNYPGCGDLKRNMKIPSLFCGILDIHGYTSFCQKHGRNLSMLQLLDEVIQIDVADVAKEHGVMAKRARGDEIILMGASASSMLKAVLSIVDFFQKRRVIQQEGLSRSRSGYRIMLPDMTISAGVSGGQKYTPIIITKDGDLSGHLINTAARLQARANKLAPSKTKLLLSSHVYTSLMREEKISGAYIFEREKTFFWNAGPVSFKGTTIPVYELIFNQEDEYKKQLKQPMEDLFQSIKKGRWEQPVFVDLVNLISRALKFQKNFSVEDPETGDRLVSRDLIGLLDHALVEYVSRYNYKIAVEVLKRIEIMLRRSGEFDSFLLEYLSLIVGKYQQALDMFMKEINEILDSRIDFLLPVNLRNNYRNAERNLEIYNRLRNSAMDNPELGNKKMLWFRTVEKHREDFSIEIITKKD
jgi:class 3 adenylate cyclase